MIDGAGQKLAYVYYEEEPGRRSAAKLLASATAKSRRTKGLLWQLRNTPKFHISEAKRTQFKS